MFIFFNHKSYLNSNEGKKEEGIFSYGEFEFFFFFLIQLRIVVLNFGFILK
jgi:hypothetical protein